MCCVSRVTSLARNSFSSTCTGPTDCSMRFSRTCICSWWNLSKWFRVTTSDLMKVVKASKEVRTLSSLSSLDP